MKPTQGGKRKNAGRKKLEVPKRGVTVMLDPRDIDKLSAICKASGLSQAKWVTRKIQEDLADLKIPGDGSEMREFLGSCADETGNRTP